MEKFEFANNILELDLCGKPFSIEVDEETIKKCEKIRCDASAKLTALKCGGEDAKTADICGFLASGIDELLGGGAAAEIFGTRRMALLDLTDLLSFILEKIRGVIAQRTKHYAPHRSGGAENA